MFESSINSYEKMMRVLQNLACSALNNWDIQAKEIQLIKYRENAVFKIISIDDKQYALRVHRGGYHTDDELRSELEWMTALQENGIHVPTIVETKQHQLFINETTEGLLKPLQIDLFEWIDGSLLGSVEKGVGQNLETIQNTYTSIGNMAARLHNQAVSWEIPKNFKRHQWDLEGLVGEHPFWGRFWELSLLTENQRQLIIQARDIIKKEMIELSQKIDIKENFSLIHADFVPENLIVVEDKVRLIDFDDAGFGWHMFELATALYFIQEEPYYEVAKNALIEGYRQFRPLSDDMILKLPIFMMVRGFTYLGWLHTRPDSKDGEEFAPRIIELACRQAEHFINDAII